MEEQTKTERDEFEKSLIKIKLMINQYYENIGRFGSVDNVDMEDLIAEIDDIVNQARLDKRKLILTKIEEE